MHAQDDRVAFQFRAAHARHEHIARGGLHDILDQLAVIGLQPLPLAGVLVHALVGEFARIVDLHVAVAQVATARQADARVAHAVRPIDVVAAQQAAHLEAIAGVAHRIAHGTLRVVPQLLRRRVRLAPRVDDLHDALVIHGVEDRAAHRPVRAQPAAVASGQFRHLALRLPLFLRHIDRVFAEDASGGHLVQVWPLSAIVQLERLDLPVLARQPRQHAPLDVREVGDDQLVARCGHQTAAHGEGAPLADVVVDHILAVVLEGRDRGLLHLAVEPVGRAREVLRLEDAPRVATGARRSAELDRAAQATVVRCRVDQGAVLSGAGGCGLLPDFQKLARQRVEVALQQLLNSRLREVFRLNAALVAQEGEQGRALRRGRHSTTRQSGGTSGQRSRSSFESSDSSAGEVSIDGDTTVINSLVDPPKVDFSAISVPSWNASSYVSHSVHIAPGVFDEGVPVIRVRFPARPTQLPVLRRGLREQLYMTTPLLVFSFILRDAKNVAELAEGRGQAVL